MRRSADDLLRRQRRRALPAAVARCAALLTLAAVLPAPAHAEEVFTGQAAAANATDSTWIDPPAQRAAVCIVDSGNDPNPDTTNVIARLAVDGGDGGDVDPNKHGTLMSMIASAPYNGWGMVGAAPSVNVVSVRAMRSGGGGTFGLADILAGIQICEKYSDIYNIKAVSLSLGAQHSGNLDSASEAAIRGRVDQARKAGLSVFAAAGNHGGPVDWPAAYPTVVAIGASDGEGNACPFAASGPEVDLWTLGCRQDVTLTDGRSAWASGSSGATAFAAAALAQLRGLTPTLTVDASESLLRTSAGLGAAGATLDIAAMFLGAGLSDQLAKGRSATPATGQRVDGTAPKPPREMATAPAGESEPKPLSASPDPKLTQPPSGTATAERLPRPVVRSIRYRSRRLTLLLANKPADLQAEVQLYTRSRWRPFPRVSRTLRVRNDRIQTHVFGTLVQLSIIYRDPTRKRLGSVAVVIRL